MPLKSPGPGDEPTVVSRWTDGLTWMAHPTEEMQRASHALVIDEDIWLVDPLDAMGLDDELETLGTVAGVVVLTNSHGRHAERLAERHDVSVHVPACFDDPISDFDAHVETFEAELADTGFRLVWEKDGKAWKEGALYHPDRGTLVVPDALGTGLFANGELSVFPLFQWSPPRDKLEQLAVERVLVGHGEPVMENATPELEAALSTSRTGAASAVVRAVPTFARIAYGEVRG